MQDGRKATSSDAADRVQVGDQGSGTNLHSPTSSVVSMRQSGH